MTMISNGLSEAGKRIAQAGVEYQHSQTPAGKREEADFQRRVSAVSRALYGPLNDPTPFVTPYGEPLHVQVHRLINDACRFFDVSRNELLSPRKERRIAIARFYVVQRLRDETSLSMPRIGKIMGGRDHTTILHACKPEQRARVAEFLAGKGAA